VQIFQEFMPEPGERAEPIAMGRQTIWGGAGKPPSREVMAAAAKAARTEMLQRVREKKASDGSSSGRGNGGGGQRQRQSAQGEGQPRGDGQREGGRGEGGRGEGRRGGGGGGGRNGQGNRSSNQGNNAPRHADQRANRGPREDREPRGEGSERQPGPNAHLGSLRIREPRPRSAAPGGQPDPLRTSIDSMRSGNRGGGKGNNRGGGGGGGQRGGNGGGADPLRTSFGRIR
jgi:ATP-dependent RNA helicase RhlE